MSITSQYRKMYENKVLNEGQTYDMVNTVLKQFKDRLDPILTSSDLNNKLKNDSDLNNENNKLRVELETLHKYLEDLTDSKSTLYKLRMEPVTDEPVTDESY